MATTPSPRQNFWHTWLNSLSRVAPPSAKIPGVMLTSLPFGSGSQRHPQSHESADRGARSSAGREPQEITPTDLHRILPAGRVGLGRIRVPDDIRTGF